MSRWWERFPGRGEYELAELARRGYEYQRDEASWAAGRLELTATCSIGDVKVLVRAFFPDSYPYFPPAVTAPDLTVLLHQDPVSKLLCLLPDDTRAWSPSDDCLASLLDEQLPKLLRGATAGTTAAPADALPDAEPISAFLTYEAGSHLSVGLWTIAQDVSHGKLFIGFDNVDPARGAVLAIANPANEALARADEQIIQRYGGRTQLHARWGRLEAPPIATDAENLYRNLTRLHAHLAIPQWITVRDDEAARIQFEILGALFQEEEVRGQVSDNWLFLARRAIHPPRHRHRSNVGRASVRAQTRVTLVRSGRESAETNRARVPELRPLTDKKIALVGAGSIGSVCAVELARAGVRELAIWDSDYLEVANTVRWAAGRTYAGLAKVQALREHIEREYPYTRVSQYPYRMGHPVIPVAGASESGYSETDQIEQMLAGVALVLDATAQFSVGHLLSQTCLERKIPHVWVNTTPGAWGGLIARSIPGKTAGCWRCSKYFQDEEKLPSPVSSPEGDRAVHPIGCLHPTFTGAALDINQVALAAVRMIASTLCSDTKGGYPFIPWDYSVVNFRSDTGEVIAPSWSTAVLQKHPSCDHS